MIIDEIKDLIAYNSYGGFNQSGNEYHILNTSTPLPWCNVMANENFGTIISNYGTVYTYYKNSREFKITEWCNDWITFTPGEKFTGIFERDYNVIYGFGYTKIVEETDDIRKNMDIFIPVHDNLKVQNITLENIYGDEKEFEIEYSLIPVLGVAKEANSDYILCREYDGVMEFKNPYSLEFSNCTAFIKLVSGTDNFSYTYNETNYSLKIKGKLKSGEIAKFAIILRLYRVCRYWYKRDYRKV